MKQRTTSILPQVYYNSIYIKLVLRENKKRKTNVASTSREESPHNKWMMMSFGPTLMGKMTKGRRHQHHHMRKRQNSHHHHRRGTMGLPQTHTEETNPPPPPLSWNIWTTLETLTARVDHMAPVMEEMRRDQDVMRMNLEVLIRDMGVPFRFLLMITHSTIHRHPSSLHETTRREMMVRARPVL